MKIEDHINWAKVIVSKYRKERNIPIEYKEAISLGMLGLMKAVRNYKEDKGKFRSFAWKRVRGELADWTRTSTNRKSIAMMIDLEDLSEGQLPSVNGTEKKVINKDLIEKILTLVRPNEAYALRRYYLNGLRMHEIGAEMGITESRISQILTRGRKRAKNIIIPQLEDNNNAIHLPT